MREKLLSIYNRLLEHFGPQDWWPADSPFEVIIGAILTQSVSWGNVEKAMANLKGGGALDPLTLARIPEEELAELIKPSGYYRVKAKKVRSFLSFLNGRYKNSLSALFSQPQAELRRQLLAVWGIGPETADSILLYAGGYPSFVIDAYTHRVISRLGLAPEGTGYEDLQGLFQHNLPPDTALFNEFHALLVSLGKNYCQKNNPRCGDCPLNDDCAGANRGL